MIRNFFKTAWRNILKNKAYSLINFIGLTSGMALALLILVYVRSEVSYDHFHNKLDRLYRLRYVAPNGLELASSPPPIAPVMPDHFPEVEQTARVYGRNVSISRPDDDQVFEETNVYFVDSTLMDMFTFDFVKGNPAEALDEKFTVVITESMATKYFGNENPIGESLILGGRHPFRVAGIIKDTPQNSHIDFHVLVPYDNMFDLENDQTATVLRNNLAVNFIISHSYTYVLLKPGANPANVDAGMDDFLKKYARPQFLVGQKFTLMPVDDIHLKSTLLAEPSATNSLSNLYIFIGVGILTLLIASINYINLSTAQSFTRIKEIGVRKILGSHKTQLISQFLAESFLFSLVSLLLAYGLFYILLPVLNMLTDKQLTFAGSVDRVTVLSSVALLTVVTLLAGGYPSYFVAQFNSIQSLKGSGITQYGSQWLRKALVVFQLAIACMLLAGSLLIIRQLDFLRNQPLGFQKDQVINIPLFSQNLNGVFRQRDSTFQVRLQSYRDAVEAQTGVSATTVSSGAPGLGAVYRGTVPEGFTDEERMFIPDFSVDYDFIKTYGLELVTGRPFSREHGTDETSAFIVNEMAVKEFKWDTPDKALGKTINREGKIGQVVGVIKDFNIASLTTPMTAMIMEINPLQYNTLSVKIDNANLPETLGKLESTWNMLFPEKGFQYTFLDEQLDQQYQNFRNFGWIIEGFTIIAILISCLGVYGLVLFVVQRKVKEIGVRKVLGASVGNILRLIYQDFVWLVLIGFVLAIPASYYLMTQWLENFQYRISLDVVTYAISLIIVVVIVAGTVSYQAVRASLANPVKSLRSE